MFKGIRVALAIGGIGIAILGSGCGSNADVETDDVSRPADERQSPAPEQVSSSPHSAEVICVYACPTNPDVEFICQCSATCLAQCTAACGGVSCHRVD